MFQSLGLAIRTALSCLLISFPSLAPNGVRCLTKGSRNGPGRPQSALAYI